MTNKSLPHDDPRIRELSAEFARMETEYRDSKEAKQQKQQETILLWDDPALDEMSNLDRQIAMLTGNANPAPANTVYITQPHTTAPAAPRVVLPNGFFRSGRDCCDSGDSVPIDDSGDSNTDTINTPDLASPTDSGAIDESSATDSSGENTSRAIDEAGSRGNANSTNATAESYWHSIGVGNQCDESSAEHDGDGSLSEHDSDGDNVDQNAHTDQHTNEHLHTDNQP